MKYFLIIYVLLVFAAFFGIAITMIHFIQKFW